jgi:hypothetical protein
MLLLYCLWIMSYIGQIQIETELEEEITLVEDQS